MFIHETREKLVILWSAESELTKNTTSFLLEFTFVLCSFIYLFFFGQTLWFSLPFQMVEVPWIATEEV